MSGFPISSVGKSLKSPLFRQNFRRFAFGAGGIDAFGAFGHLGPCGLGAKRTVADIV